MDEKLKKLHKIFYSDNYTSEVDNNWFIEAINGINNQFNLNFPISNNALKLIVEEIYNNDNVALLYHILMGKISFDWNRNACKYDLEGFPDIDENNEDIAGDTGYYSIETKNRKAIYSKLDKLVFTYEF